MYVFAAIGILGQTRSRSPEGKECPGIAKYLPQTCTNCSKLERHRLCSVERAWAITISLLLKTMPIIEKWLCSFYDDQATELLKR